MLGVGRALLSQGVEWGGRTQFWTVKDTKLDSKGHNFGQKMLSIFDKINDLKHNKKVGI